MIAYNDCISNEELLKAIKQAEEAQLNNPTQEGKEFILNAKAVLLARKMSQKDNSLEFFAERCTRTMPNDEERDEAKKRMVQLDELFHAQLGISSEAGEIADCIKRHFCYGAPLDSQNLVEECGDLLWYIALLLQSIGFTLTDAAAYNIVKLQERYPTKFTLVDALDRKDKS